MENIIMHVELWDTGDSSDKPDEESRYYAAITAAFGGDMALAMKAHAEFSSGGDSDLAERWADADTTALDAAFSEWHRVPESAWANVSFESSDA